MTRAAIYVRISSDREGGGLGVERQENDCRELAKELGWDVAVVHTDNDISAYSGKPRPGYAALLEDLEAGSVDAVLAWHTDRLYRRSVDLEALVDLVKAKGIKIRTVKAGELELSNPTGVAIAEILASIAKMEVAHAVERMESAHRQRAAAGRIHGGARPFGWKADRIHKDPAEAAEIVKWSVHILAGGSLGDLVRDLNGRGIPTAQHRDLGARIRAAKKDLAELAPDEQAKLAADIRRMQLKRKNLRWNKQQIRQILMSRRLAGWRVHRGQITTKGEWDPIISEDAHQQLVAVLTDPSRNLKPAIPERRHLLSGLALCAKCKAPVTIKTAKRRDKAIRRSYHCATCGLYRDKDPVDDYVERYAVRRLRLKDVPDIPAGADDGRLEFLRAKYQTTLRLFAGNDTVGPEDQLVMLDGIKAEIAAETARLAPATDARRLRVIAQADADEFPGYPIARKRSVIDALCVVRLKRVPRGGRRAFDPKSVVIVRR